MKQNGQTDDLAALSLGKDTPIIHWIGGPQRWCGHGGEEKNPNPCCGSNPSHPAHIPSLYCSD